MTLYEVSGDLFDPKWGFQIIGHGANAIGVMGAGIAKTIKERYPHTHQEYQQACQEWNPHDAGGSIVWTFENSFVASRDIVPEEIYIANMITQIQPGANASYDLIDKAMHPLVKVGSGLPIGLPEIGCGIGGLKWSIVKSIIGHHANSYNGEITVVHYKG